jgi:AAA+ superfamily predicted ATPase
MTANISINELFETRIEFPDPDGRDRLNRLVGLDEQKARISKMLGVLINPDGLKNWAMQHHKGAPFAVDTFTRRPPLLILAGDVGSGKTELAETIGDLVARQENIDITLYPMSLSTRGQGRVGEMTQLLSSAFDCVGEHAAKLKRGDGKAAGGVILLVDEADALAQSRESAQMHHEDRAGVNAFIRGIDKFASRGLPVAVIMCTNRLSALDPAVKRRAADILKFERPSELQRHAVLSPMLTDLGFSNADIAAIVKTTGAINREYGFTFSDLTQRLLPSILLDAYPNSPVLPARAVELANKILPTPPFKDGVEE